MAAKARSDAELVRRCTAGDDEAWGELVQRFSRYVYAITQAFRLRREDAEDVFQEVFAKAYERLENLRDVSAVRPWLGQLARRACIDRLRLDSRASFVEVDADVSEPYDLIDELEDAFAVHAALAELSPECSEILDRFFARDESYRTIAQELQLPAGTVASRISRCLGRLRDRLGEEVAGEARLVNR